MWTAGFLLLTAYCLLLTLLEVSLPLDPELLAGANPFLWKQIVPRSQFVDRDPELTADLEQGVPLDHQVGEKLRFG